MEIKRKEEVYRRRGKTRRSAYRYSHHVLGKRRAWTRQWRPSRQREVDRQVLTSQERLVDGAS